MAFMTDRSSRRLALVLAAALSSAPALAQSEDPALHLAQPTRARLLLDTNNPRQIWGAVMKAVGPYDKAQKCWTLATGGRRFCMRPSRVLLSATGKPMIVSPRTPRMPASFATSATTSSK